MEHNRLRYFREDALLTQSELAELVGISSACISRLETGTRAGRWTTRKKIARALNVSETEIFPPALTLTASGPV